jgi:hypothetical protein
MERWEICSRSTMMTMRRRNEAAAANSRVACFLLSHNFLEILMKSTVPRMLAG